MAQSAAVVGDAEGGALALLHGAEVDLLQLVEGDGWQHLGRGLGGLCLLFCGDGRGGFIAHAVVLLSAKNRWPPTSATKIWLSCQSLVTRAGL